MAVPLVTHTNFSFDVLNPVQLNCWWDQAVCEFPGYMIVHMFTAGRTWLCSKVRCTLLHSTLLEMNKYQAQDDIFFYFKFSPVFLAWFFPLTLLTRFFSSPYIQTTLFICFLFSNASMPLTTLTRIAFASICFLLFTHRVIAEFTAECRKICLDPFDQNILLTECTIDGSTKDNRFNGDLFQWSEFDLNHILALSGTQFVFREK